MAMVYLAQTLLVTAIYLAGGLQKVPFVVFGFAQYLPGLVVLLLVPEWRSRLWWLLFKSIPRMSQILGYWLLTAVVLLACIAIPYFAGHHGSEFNDALVGSYRLRFFVPNLFLNTTLFPVFLLVLGPVLHLINATGEEIYWRGYLLDVMRPRFRGVSLGLINGFFWGIWHAPMVMLLDWDFPGYPVWGIVAITVSEMFWSVPICHVRLKTDSLIVPVVMHATANALTLGLYDLIVDRSYNLAFSPWGLVGGSLMALVTLVLWRRMTNDE